MGTGVVGLLGGEAGTGMYGGSRPLTWLLGRRTLRPQAARRVCHPDFPPKLATCSMMLHEAMQYDALGGIVPTTRGFDINVDAQQYTHVFIIRCGGHGH